MKVTFVGVGEACDQNQTNTSLLVESAKNKVVLLDCGFTVPHRYFGLDKKTNNLSGLWVSHFHGDHFFGVPLLLLRFWETGRSALFTIIGPKGIENVIRQAMELAYPSLLNKFEFPLCFHEMKEGENLRELGFSWSPASVGHSCNAMAVKLDDGERSLFYSGDGMATPESMQLAADCDLVVHEAYRLKGETPGHGTVPLCLELAENTRIRKLALVHIARREREGVQKELGRLQQIIPQVQLIVPDSGDEIEV